MSMRVGARFAGCVLALSVGVCVAIGQDTAAQTPAKVPLDQVIGTVTALDANSHTITVKEDKTGTDHTVLLANTKTLLKVAPGAKDLKTASRITADDLAVGDRVQVRGLKAEDNPNALAAKSVVLMSARDLQQAHQAQAAEWQHATAGVVSSVDTAAGTVTISTKTADGQKPVIIQTARGTEFTRYSPDDPKSPAPSLLAQIQAGDQVRVIGEKNEDGSKIDAQRVYSGAFRTISATVNSIAPDGKSVTVKDLATKKAVEIDLNDNSAVRKLPPMMAAMLARRFNPNYKPAADGSGGASPAPNAAAPPTGAAPGGEGRPGGMRSGAADVSQMLERVPKIDLSELKPGDALVISGVATGPDSGKLLATNVIAGVEPILQSSPARSSGQSLGGDWGLGEMSAPQ